MKAKAAFYFLILCRQLLSLERYRRKKGVKVKVHCVLWYIFCLQLMSHLHDSAIAKFSTKSHETDYSVGFLLVFPSFRVRLNLFSAWEWSKFQGQQI
jgi:hypothetical protein